MWHRHIYYTYIHETNQIMRLIRTFIIIRTKIDRNKVLLNWTITWQSAWFFVGALVVWVGPQRILGKLWGPAFFNSLRDHEAGDICNSCRVRTSSPGTGLEKQQSSGWWRLFTLNTVDASSWQCYLCSGDFPANTRRVTNVGLKLAHRLRRWYNIKPTSARRLAI